LLSMNRSVLYALINDWLIWKPFYLDPFQKQIYVRRQN